MKLLLLLLFSSKIKGILLLHIHVEEDPHRNFSSATTKPTVDVSPQNITSVEESSINTRAIIISVKTTPINIISRHQTITNTTSFSEILASNTMKPGMNQVQSMMVPLNHSQKTSDTTNQIIKEETSEPIKNILPATEVLSNVTSAYETSTATNESIPTQHTTADEPSKSTTAILPPLETPQNVTSAQETSTITPEVISTQKIITKKILESTNMVSLNTTSNINQTQSTTSIPTSTQQAVSALILAPQNETMAANQTLASSQVTPFANMTKKAKGSKQNKQKASKTTPLVTSPKTKTTHAPRETAPLTPISRIPPTTREIDYKESVEFGEDNFKKFMFNTTVFIDKSLMIKEFLEHDKQVILITRPTHWGKSLNLNMLRKFFEIEVDHQGNILPEENQVNRKLFFGGQIHMNDSQVKSFQALKISNFSSAMEHQGKHPVVQLTYHSIKNGTFEEFKEGMMDELIKSYKKHFYLNNYFKVNPQLLDESEKSQLERFYKRNLTEDDLVNSLHFLSQLLHKYFNQTVFILIDEYDTPLRDAFLHSSDNPDNLEKVLKFYRDFYTSAFKNNAYLAKGFLTGELRIANSNLFINLDNMAEYTVLDHEFSQFYGFTEQELDELMAPSLKMEQALDRQCSNFTGLTEKELDKKVGPSLKTQLHQMKLYYKGYNYGGQTMYNPWSIKQCMENNYRLEQYWLPCGVQFPGRQQSYSLDDLVEDVKKLLGGHSIVIPIENEVSFENLADRRNFFNFILFTGYLSPTAKHPNGTYELVRPNPEAKMLYECVLGNWMPKRPWG